MNDSRTFPATAALEGQPLSITAARRWRIFFMLIFVALYIGIILFFAWGWTGDMLMLAGIIAPILFSIKRPSSVWNPEPYAVTIDSAGIRSHDRKRPQAYLAWSAITVMRDCPHANMLELYGPPEVPPFQVVYELKHFAKLTQFLLEKLPQERILKPFPITFQAQMTFSFYSLLPFLSCFLVIAGFFLKHPDRVESLFLLLAISVGLFLIAFQLSLRSLEIHPTAFRIHKRWTVRDIPYQEIEAVNFISARDPFNGGEATRLFDVRVSLTTNREVSILPEGCDAIAVYQTAKSAWEAVTKRTA